MKSRDLSIVASEGWMHNMGMVERPSSVDWQPDVRGLCVLGFSGTGFGEEQTETGMKCHLQAQADESSGWLGELCGFW